MLPLVREYLTPGAANPRGAVVAVENEGRGQVSFPVTDMRAHPSYRDEPDRLGAPLLRRGSHRGHHAS